MKKLLTCFFAATAMLVLPGLVMGQSNFTGGGDGSTWNDAANWDAGIPAGVNADIEDSSAVTLATDQTINELDLVGDQSTGTASLAHTAGTLTSGGWMKIGGSFEGAVSDGTYSLSGTASAVGQTQTQVGFGGGTGALSISDSANFETLEGLNIAGGNTGVVGVGDNSVGTLNVSGDATVTADRINMAGAGSVATVNQTGGTVTSNNWIALANFGAAGTATYSISAGSVTANNGNFALGQEGSGTLNVSGTAVVTQISAGTNAILVGGIADGDLIVDGTGTLNITGSTASITGSDLRFALTPGSTGTASWTADAGGITTIVSGDNTEFAAGESNLVLDMSADSASATAGTQYVLVDNSAAVTGTFTGVAEGDTVSIGGGNDGTISYAGGADGFDIVVTAVGGGGGVAGDFDGDGDADCDDLNGYVGNINAAATGALAALDLDSSGTLEATDANSHIATLVVTQPNGVTGTFPGDLNCDGSVSVLGDAFTLVGNLGSSVLNYTDGDINFDGTVTVLGDAFTLVGNLGMSN